MRRHVCWNTPCPHRLSFAGLLIRPPPLRNTSLHLPGLGSFWSFNALQELETPSVSQSTHDTSTSISTSISTSPLIAFSTQVYGPRRSDALHAPLPAIPSCLRHQFSRIKSSRVLPTWSDIRASRLDQTGAPPLNILPHPPSPNALRQDCCVLADPRNHPSQHGRE